MARTKKGFTIKRDEMLNKVWYLFLTNGYENTTLALILKELEISKGVFYHYFESKEDCAKAAVDLYTTILANKTMQQCREQAFETQNPVAQFQMLLDKGKQLCDENAMPLKGIDSTSNRIFHQMLMVSLTKKFAAIYAQVIKDGVNAKCFSTAYPLQMAEMALVLSNFYFDENFFGWEDDGYDKRIAAFKELITKGLGLELGLGIKESTLFETPQNERNEVP